MINTLTKRKGGHGTCKPPECTPVPESVNIGLGVGLGVFIILIILFAMWYYGCLFCFSCGSSGRKDKRSKRQRLKDGFSGWLDGKRPVPATDDEESQQSLTTGAIRTHDEEGVWVTSNIHEDDLNSDGDDDERKTLTNHHPTQSKENFSSNASNISSDERETSYETKKFVGRESRFQEVDTEYLSPNHSVLNTPGHVTPSGGHEETSAVTTTAPEIQEETKTKWWKRGRQSNSATGWTNASSSMTGVFSSF